MSSTETARNTYFFLQCSFISILVKQIDFKKRLKPEFNVCVYGSHYVNSVPALALNEHEFQVTVITALFSNI